MSRAVALFAGKVLLGLVALLTVLALAGCKRAEVKEAEAAAELRMRSSETYLTRVADPDTQCEYLIYDGKTLAPRIAADGKTHMGCKGAQ